MTDEEQARREELRQLRLSLRRLIRERDGARRALTAVRERLEEAEQKLSIAYELGESLRLQLEAERDEHGSATAR